MHRFKPWWCVIALVLGGCTTFHEEHYFQTTDPDGNPANFFRIRVNGSGGLTRLRYLSGYYDERAVDLYFNEVKTAPQGQSGFDIQPLFAANQLNPGTQDVIKPLDPTNHGALLMIFSSNPNAIADTIGQFAENQQVAQALTNLVNRDEVKAQRVSARTLAARRSRFTASAAEVGALLTALPDISDTNTAVPAAKKNAVKATYLNVLRSIAITLGGDGKFDDFDQAEAWINAKRSELP